MLVDSWTKPIETVTESLRQAADHLDTISKFGEVSFKDMSRILHVLESAQAVVRLIPDNIGDLRSYIHERKPHAQPDS